MILIACRASQSIGFGHLMRSRAIADFAKSIGVKVVLVGPSLEHREQSDTYRFVEWVSDVDRSEISGHAAVGALALLAKRHACRHLILDDYSYSGEEQMALHEKGYRLLQQYDASAPPKFAADLAVNASPAEHADLHVSRIMHQGVRFLNGPAYAVLRPMFANVQRRTPDRDVKRILVTFGGGDDRGGILFVLRALADRIPVDIELVVLTGANNANIAEIEEFTRESKFGNISVEISPKDPASVIASCDLAIMAGGTTVYEAAFCGLPMILISIASNQEGQCQGWQRLGAARYLGPLTQCQEDVLVDTAMNMIESRNLRKSMTQKGMEHVDLNGSSRLLNALLA